VPQVAALEHFTLQLPAWQTSALAQSLSFAQGGTQRPAWQSLGAAHWLSALHIRRHSPASQS